MVMMYDNVVLECGHKVRQSTFKQCHELGTCPRHICLQKLSEKDREFIAQQTMMFTAPLWELYIVATQGRRANEQEISERNEKLAKRPPILPICAGFTLAGSKCGNVAMRNNGKFCRFHVPK